jgi:hypothetical protein
MQLHAWEVTATWLHQVALSLPSSHNNTRFLFEHRLPLSQERPDLIVLTDDLIVVVEAKTGNHESLSAARAQTLQYARSVYNFASIASGRAVVPVLLRTNATGKTGQFCIDHPPTDESVFDLDVELFQQLIHQSSPLAENIDSSKLNWIYRPRPDIVDAARVMFAGVSDEDILEGLADDEELIQLISRCESLVQEAHQQRQHFVVAITGVPGAGKTLVGLRLVNSGTIQAICAVKDKTAPMYLSGNGPLVEVLTEALIRDATVKQGLKKEDARDAALAKIRLIHGLTTNKFMVNAHVVVFDEAQRAWTEDRMVAKLQRHDLGSESEEVLRRMEDQEWSVVFCLIGTGQEINKGERGLETWIKAVDKLNLRDGRKNWTLFLADSRLHDAQNENQKLDQSLHLKVVRRAENASTLADWVEHLLSGDFDAASAIRREFTAFPILVTRNLELAKNWLRAPQDARLERIGLVASSSSARLSIYGVDAPASASDAFDWPQWFLDVPPNLNSSMTLEVAASEFKCQGLELDRVGVCWSWDFIHDGEGWVTRKIRRRQGKWGRNDKGREFAVAAYRVLLTRARKGMIVWVPRGDESDPTRPPAEMDHVFDLLVQAGAVELVETN